MIILKDYNELYYLVETDLELHFKLKNYFSIKSPGFFFNQMYKLGLWNGRVDLYKKPYLLKGLLPELNKFCQINKVTLVDETTNQINEIDIDNIINKIQSYNLTNFDKKTKKIFDIEVRDYQLNSIIECLKNKKQFIESSTSSGKSLIIYCLTRILEEKLGFNKKIVIIVPTITLVNQMYSDFNDYSRKDLWNVEDRCSKINSTSKDVYDKNIIISTYQSLIKQNYSFFKQFEVVILDEAHLVGNNNTKKSKSIYKIINNCINSKYRFGFSGSYPDEILYKKTIQGLFINHYKATNYQMLLNNDYITNFEVDCIILNHRKLLLGKSYQTAIDYIQNDEYRNEFIKKLLLKIKHNSLLLFREVDNHSQKVFDELINDKRFKDYKIYIVSSKKEHNMVNKDELKYIIENNDNVIVLATYSLLSTGWSVNNLHNVIFAAPLKSKPQIIQSIGRSLRKCEDKNVAKIYDIADKMQYNVLWKQFLEREKIYISENINYRKINIGD